MRYKILENIDASWQNVLTKKIRYVAAASVNY